MKLKFKQVWTYYDSGFWKACWAQLRKLGVAGFIFAVAIPILVWFVSHEKDSTAGQSLYNALVACIILASIWVAISLVCAPVVKALNATSLKNSDPRIEVFYERDVHVVNIGRFQITNRGTKAIYEISIAPITLSARRVTFPEVLAALEPNVVRGLVPYVGTDQGQDRSHDLVRALSQEWTREAESHPGVREVTVPARIDYRDADNTRFECYFDVLYHGGQGWNHPNLLRCIDCLNFRYRRIAQDAD